MNRNLMSWTEVGDRKEKKNTELEEDLAYKRERKKR